ncbi:MAG: Hsp20/alpha crystallin family protein [Gammaproteobacteria bacterium]
MQQITRLLSTGILLGGLLPVTAWGYGLSQYHPARAYHPYAGPAASSHYRAGLRVHTGRTGDGYTVRINLDGARPEDIKVSTRRGRLVLQISQGSRYGRNHPGARSVSQWRMCFRKQLRLPNDADRTRMTTRTNDGIMEIHIPVVRQYRPIDPSR